MNQRQRVLQTLRFEATDRPPFDLMEGCVWPELLEYFRLQYGWESPERVIEEIDPDFRWTFLQYQGPPLPEAEPAPPATPLKTPKAVAGGPLAGASTAAEVEAYPWPDPSLLGPADYAQVRRRFPDQAIVFCPGWMPLFWTVCEVFGMQAAAINLLEQPALIQAALEHHHHFCMDLLRRAAPAARGHCDLALLGDDFAHQQGMMLHPRLWRQWIKPYLAEQVAILRQHDLMVLYHSCGAVRPVLEDLIEIGVNGLLVFQTTARCMDAASIARDFGGRLAFYGGIDVQHLLSSGTPQQVRDEVLANVHAFSDCGGYIVANSHHSLASIQGANLLAMCQAVKSISG